MKSRWTLLVLSLVVVILHAYQLYLPKTASISNKRNQIRRKKFPTKHSQSYESRQISTSAIHLYSPSKSPTSSTELIQKREPLLVNEKLTSNVRLSMQNNNNAIAQEPSSQNILQSFVRLVVVIIQRLRSIFRVPLFHADDGRHSSIGQELLSLPMTLFVNRKSGGKDGKNLLRSLYQQLESRYICDLLYEKPRQKLAGSLKDFQLRYTANNSSNSNNNQAISTPKLPVICCGGDGTIRWIMDEAHAIGESQNCYFGIMPMGTGNDLFNHILQTCMGPNNDRMRASRLSYQLSTNNQMYQTLRALRTFDISRNPNYQQTTRSNYISSSANSKEKDGSKMVNEKSVIPEGTIAVSENNAPFTTPFDRWEIIVRPYSPSTLRRLKNKLTSSSAALSKKFKAATLYGQSKSIESPVPSTAVVASTDDVKETVAFNNYFGIGIDGDITCAYDHLRKQRPHWFFHRLMNKAWFIMVWIYKFLRSRAKNISRDVDVYVDGRKLDLAPLGLRGIILPNIVSYAGGTKLWQFAGEKVPPYFANKTSSHENTGDNNAVASSGKEEQVWLPQSSSDGMLELVGLTSWAHLASVTGGFLRSVPIAQGRHIRIVSRVRLPMQVDGEPLLQAPCILDIQKRETVQLIIPQPVED